MIPHIIIGPKATVGLSVILAGFGALQGVTKAGTMETKINQTIDVVNGLMKMGKVMGKNPIK
jgi:hypothetical protein